jgi:hypothetical protein
MAARLTLDQLVKVRILLRQLSRTPIFWGFLFLLMRRPLPTLIGPQGVVVRVVVNEVVAINSCEG